MVVISYKTVRVIEERHGVIIDGYGAEVYIDGQREIFQRAAPKSMLSMTEVQAENVGKLMKAKLEAGVCLSISDAEWDDIVADSNVKADSAVNTMVVSWESECATKFQSYLDELESMYLSEPDKLSDREIEILTENGRIS